MYDNILIKVESCLWILFKCRPHAYCDSNGRVFYNFNPDKVVLYFLSIIFLIGLKMML